MKIAAKILLPLLMLVMISCATNSGVNNEKKQSTERLLFKDWKYKGFGQPLPVWFEAAWENNKAKLQKLLPELVGLEFLVLKGEGINSDQADRSLELAAEDISNDYQLYDFCWGMIEEEHYIALAIYTKE